MGEIAGYPYWELSFDESGGLTSPDSAQFVAEVASSGSTDVFMMSHGWSPSRAAARDLYAAVFPMLAAAEAAGDARVSFAGIFWPSLWFPDPPSDAPTEVAEAADGFFAAGAVLSGQQIADALKPAFDDPQQRANLDQMGRLIDQGAAWAGHEPPASQHALLAQFHKLLRTLIPPEPLPAEDSGELALLTSDDPSHAYTALSFALGSEAATGISGDRDTIWHGAKQALRMAAYYKMKTCADRIGRKGLAPLLERLSGQDPGIRVHLLGRDLGARLVAFAACGITSSAASPVASLYLVEGALSAWSFANVTPFGTAGALSHCNDRVHGPLVAIFSENDRAMSRAYQAWVRRPQQDAASDIDPANLWSAMDSHGFQGVSPARSITLLPGGAYSLTPGSFYNVDRSAVLAGTSQPSFTGADSLTENPEAAWLAAVAWIPPSQPGTPATSRGGSPAGPEINLPQSPAIPSPQPISFDDLVSRAFDEEVHPGRLIFNPPSHMRLGDTERVEVILARTFELDARLLQNLRGRGRPQLEEIPTSPIMAVTLHGDGFQITPHSDEEQAVTPDEPTLWEFDIRAVERGLQRLYMSVSLRLPVLGQPLKHKSIPVREATIDVQVGTAALVGHFMSKNWQWFIGTGIAIAAVIVAIIFH